MFVCDKVKHITYVFSKKSPTVPWILENGPVVPDPLVNTCALFRPWDPAGLNGLSWRTSMRPWGSQPWGFQNNYAWNNRLNQDEMNLFFGGFLQDPQLTCLFESKPAFIGMFSLIPSPLGKPLNLQLLDIKQFNEHVVEIKKNDGWTARK